MTRLSQESRIPGTDAPDQSQSQGTCTTHKATQCTTILVPVARLVGIPARSSLGPYLTNKLTGYKDKMQQPPPTPTKVQDHIPPPTRRAGAAKTPGRAAETEQLTQDIAQRETSHQPPTEDTPGPKKSQDIAPREISHQPPTEDTPGPKKSQEQPSEQSQTTDSLEDNTRAYPFQLADVGAACHTEDQAPVPVAVTNTTITQCATIPAPVARLVGVPIITPPPANL